MVSIFETDRLLAREMTIDDLDFVAAMLADPEVMRHYPRCHTRDEASWWIVRQGENYARYGYGRWLILEKEQGQPVGQVGLLPQRVEGMGVPEVAYMIDRRCWRRGYGSESAGASRDYAFQVLDKPRVISLIRPRNLSSIGVATRIGMKPGRKVVHSGLVHRVYSIDREAFECPQG